MGKMAAADHTRETVSESCYAAVPFRIGDQLLWYPGKIRCFFRIRWDSDSGPGGIEPWDPYENSSSQDSTAPAVDSMCFPEKRIAVMDLYKLQLHDRAAGKHEWIVQDESYDRGCVVEKKYCETRCFGYPIVLGIGTDIQMLCRQVPMRNETYGYYKGLRHATNNPQGNAHKFKLYRGPHNTGKSAVRGVQ